MSYSNLDTFHSVTNLLFVYATWYIDILKFNYCRDLICYVFYARRGISKPESYMRKWKCTYNYVYLCLFSLLFSFENDCSSSFYMPYFITPPTFIQVPCLLKKIYKHCRISDNSDLTVLVGERHRTCDVLMARTGQPLPVEAWNYEKCLWLNEGITILVN
jgi:hypothetical protein